MSNTTGKIYDIQGFSVHDGPGIRLTVFLKGCPLRCPWCHSPESQGFESELNWMEVKCVGVDKCGKCLNICPNAAISKGNVVESPIENVENKTVVSVDNEKCNDCGKCAEVCLPKALYICGTDYTVDEIMEFVERDRPFFESSGGGVTISGGECLSQSDFVLELLKKCKEVGIHTAVDTSGFAKWENILKVMPYTDIFLFDLKQMDAELHKNVIQVPNEIILENARKIAANGGKFQIRIPIIPRFNDSEADFNSVGEFIVELGDAVEIVQLLPYHSLGTVKWERLRKDAPILEAEPPSEELVQARKEQLEKMGLNVTIH